MLILIKLINRINITNIIYMKVLLNCDWLVSVQLIPNSSAGICNHSAIFSNHSAIFCNHSAQICNHYTNQIRVRDRLLQNKTNMAAALHEVGVVFGSKIRLLSFS